MLKKISRGRLEDGRPNPVDVHVGNRIRLRREALSLTQEKLADLLGITFQQIQKYEKGSNRISASRLWDMSNVLSVPVDFFFDEMSEETAKASPKALLTNNITVPEPCDDPMLREETIELVKSYYKINNREIAKHLFNLAEAMSKSSFVIKKVTETAESD